MMPDYVRRKIAKALFSLAVAALVGCGPLPAAELWPGEIPHNP